MMQEIQIVVGCVTCGQPLVSGGKYCSRKCLYQGQRKRPKTAKCEACSVEFRTHGNKANRACSRACGFVLLKMDSQKRLDAQIVECNHPPQPKTCEHCGAMHLRQAAKYCSETCQYAVQLIRGSNKKKAHRPCVVCGSVFIKPYKEGHCATCSDECFSLRAASVKRASRSKRRHKHRAVMKGAAASAFDPERVLSRDGWRCQLCRVKTPKRLRGTYKPNAPELDHIVPLALGGAHSEWNTQCLCRKCNGAKSATIAGQMRLAI